MQQKLFIWAATLLGVLHMASSFASTKVDVDRYEDAALDQKYNNVCLIRSYREDVLLSHSTGTLCKKGNRSFILYAHYMNRATRHTASFDDGVEREIKEVTVLTEFMGQDTKDLKISPGRTESRPDLIVGFLSSYPENIMPAHLVHLVMPELDREHASMPDNQALIIKWNLMQGKNQYCHLAGFGNLISPWSRPDLFLSYQNHELKKTMMTGKLSYESRKNERPERELFSSTFSGYGAPGATRFERPLADGFVGASLRTEDDQVIALASHFDSLEVTDKFQQSLSLEGAILRSLKWVSECSSKEVFYRVKLRHLAIVGMGSYAYFNPNEGATIVGFGIAAIAFDLMKPLYREVSKNLYPRGFKSYYIPVLPFMSEIDAHLEAYADSSSESASDV